MDQKTAAIGFFVAGLVFIVFSKQVLVAVQWLDQVTWNEEMRKRFPGWGGKSANYKAWGAKVIGASWIVCAIFIWFGPKYTLATN